MADAQVAAGEGAEWPLSDRYEIERALAVGGMSTLYVARSLVTGERVALKVLDARLSQDPGGVQRFLREVRLTSSIGHPGIVQVRDAGVALGADGVQVPYLAMELLEGQNLADVLAAGDRTQREAMGWLRSLLSALAAVHARGVVHRDLKFENVFAVGAPGGPVTIKLIDLGIARELLDARAPTTTGTALGTVYYMAPEQALDARSVTASADVYALGVMLYQVLAGAFPFDGESPHAIIVRAHTTPHEPLGARVPGLHPGLAALVDRCLSKDPLARPRDAAALSAELAAILDEPGVGAWLAARRVDPTSFAADGVTPPPASPPDLAAAVASSLKPPSSPPVSAAPPSRGRAVWALAIAATLLVVALVSLRWGRPDAPAPPTSLPPPPVATPAPTPMEAPPTEAPAPPAPTVVAAPPSEVTPPTVVAAPALAPTRSADATARARVVRRPPPPIAP
ncbi:MAG: serine/threonine-protein kinase, partial [Deltaproteobacteria bacterium]|nr:serine/threonine-protein kinase [Deltaproteobacteria bacterium]